eukprot:scaffold10310_cov171-Amphora_coffeaeformis.AAC.1
MEDLLFVLVGDIRCFQDYLSDEDVLKRIASRACKRIEPSLISLKSHWLKDHVAHYFQQFCDEKGNVDGPLVAHCEMDSSWVSLGPFPASTLNQKDAVEGLKQLRNHIIAQVWSERDGMNKWVV